jgi:RNA-directed DNA polymerase
MVVRSDYDCNMANTSSLILNGCVTGGQPLVRNKVVRIKLSSENSQNNAWNVNPISGQFNNNNKYNSNQVRAVVALSKERIRGWVEAFNQCISNKMASEQCTIYRIHDTDLLELMRECEERRYIPSTSTCFIVTKPKQREIFAANFRDRIVQHWICMRIEPLFEERFISQGDVSWNCRKGKGTQRAVLALRDGILEVSKNCSKKAWIGRFDVQSFFMSIDIRILEEKAVAFIHNTYRRDDIDLLIYLLVTTIRHRPQSNCIKRGDVTLWNKMPRNKSLFYAEKYRGMPIGNITSQLLANFYMSFLDEYMVEQCRMVGAKYERFVDDFAVVCSTKEDVLTLRDKASKFLQEELNLSMHHNKVYIQDVTKGVYFVGSVIKMCRLYLSNRTIGGMVNTLRKLQEYISSITDYNAENAYEIEHYLSSMNSYFGFMARKNTYAIKRKTIKEYCPLFFKYFYIKGRFESVRLKSKYKVEYQLLKQENYE